MTSTDPGQEFQEAALLLPCRDPIRLRSALGQAGETAGSPVLVAEVSGCQLMVTPRPAKEYGGLSTDTVVFALKVSTAVLLAMKSGALKGVHDGVSEAVKPVAKGLALAVISRVREALDGDEGPDPRSEKDWEEYFTKKLKEMIAFVG